MDDFDPAELARIRRYGRADWRRLIPPGWERGLTPAQIEAQRREIAKRERAFEAPLARRLRKEQEEREQIERERLEAEIEQEVLAMKAEVASLRAELIRDELRWKAECAEAKRKADIAWERFMAAWKRGDFRRRSRGADVVMARAGEKSEPDSLAPAGRKGHPEQAQRGPR